VFERAVLLHHGTRPVPMYAECAVAGDWSSRVFDSLFVGISPIRYPSASTIAR